jgi:hypothetical protein
MHNYWYCTLKKSTLGNVLRRVKIVAELKLSLTSQAVAGIPKFLMRFLQKILIIVCYLNSIRGVWRRGPVNEWVSARVTPSRAASNQLQSDSSSRWRGGPISKHVEVLERAKMGPETKIDCAGEAQRKFARPTEIVNLTNPFLFI